MGSQVILPPMIWVHYTHTKLQNHFSFAILCVYMYMHAFGWVLMVHGRVCIFASTYVGLRLILILGIGIILYCSSTLLVELRVSKPNPELTTSLTNKSWWSHALGIWGSPTGIKKGVVARHLTLNNWVIFPTYKKPSQSLVFCFL